ncbi:MAG: hypothetical protein ACK415_00800 [Thermodesulfovibrionales bacterium]
METAMRCPYLEKWSVWVCKACTNIYVPNYFEVFEYCKTKKYRKCDLFYKRNAEARKDVTDKVLAR